MSKDRRPQQKILRRAYELTGNSTDAQILERLHFWLPFARTVRDGVTWVVKTDRDFIEQDGITASERTIRASLERLKEAGLVDTTRGRHPNGRAPNSRYLRPTQLAISLLEPGRGAGESRRVACPNNADDRSDLARRAAPAEPGGDRRVHRQHYSSTTHTETSTEDERRGQNSSSGTVFREGEEETSAALEEIQAGFDRGCRRRPREPHPAPTLNIRARVRALKRFAETCKLAGLTLDDAVAVAERFGEHYAAADFAQTIGRDSEKVSQFPDHFVLSIGSHHAIADWKNGTHVTGKAPQQFVKKKVL